MKTKLFFSVLSGIVLFGCSESMNQDINYPVDVPVKLLSSQSSSSSCNPNLEGDTVYIFNSREGLTNDLSCLDVRNIDWNENSFLAVKIQRFNADSKVTKSLLQEVSAGQYQLNVEITPSTTQNAAPLYFYMTVPKLSKDADIGLSVSIPEQFNVETFQLKGTQWKLAGYVDVSNGKMIDAAPKDCAQCYTIAFQSDSLGTAKSVSNEITVDLTLQPFFRVLTEINDREMGNATLFYEAAKTIDMHFWDAEGLKFFYNSRKNYMLYKQMENTTPSEINKIETQDYSLIETSCSWQHSKLKADSIYIINSQEELFSVVSCGKNDVPNIDFDKHSLLFVYGRTTSGISSINKILQKTTETNHVLNIDIKLNMTTVAQRWEIALSTPKISKNTVLELEKNIHY